MCLVRSRGIASCDHRCMSCGARPLVTIAASTVSSMSGGAHGMHEMQNLTLLNAGLPGPDQCVAVTQLAGGSRAGAPTISIALCQAAVHPLHVPVACAVSCCCCCLCCRLDMSAADSRLHLISPPPLAGQDPVPPEGRVLRWRARGPLHCQPLQAHRRQNGAGGRHVHRHHHSGGGAVPPRRWSGTSWPTTCYPSYAQASHTDAVRLCQRKAIGASSCMGR